MPVVWSSAKLEIAFLESLFWLSHREKFLTYMNRTQAVPSLHISALLAHCFCDTFMREEQMGCRYPKQLPTLAWPFLRAALSSVPHVLHDEAAGNSLHHSSLFPRCSPSHMSFKPRTFQWEVNQPSAVLPWKLMSYVIQGALDICCPEWTPETALNHRCLTGSDTCPSGVLYSGAFL